MLLFSFGADFEGAAVAGGDAAGEGHDSPCPCSAWVPGSETLASPPPVGFLRAQTAFSAEKQFFKLIVVFETAV